MTAYPPLAEVSLSDGGGYGGENNRFNMNKLYPLHPSPAKDIKK